MIAAIQNANLAGDGIASAHAATPLLPTERATSSASEASPFSDLLTDTVRDAGTLEDRARQAIDGLMAGSGVDIHQAMIASEKASMAFELALAVRNKAIQSYQSVMSMQF